MIVVGHLWALWVVMYYHLASVRLHGNQRQKDNDLLQAKCSDIYFENYDKFTKFCEYPLQSNRNMADNMSWKFCNMERSGTFVLVAKRPSVKCIWMLMLMLMLTSDTFPFERTVLDARSGEVKGECLKELLTVFQKSFKHQPIPAVSLAWVVQTPAFRCLQSTVILNQFCCRFLLVQKFLGGQVSAICWPNSKSICHFTWYVSVKSFLARQAAAQFPVTGCMFITL